MKILRITFAVLSLIVVVGVVAIGSLIIFVDPNQLKPTLVKEVMKQTGYRLLIDGHLSWSFYPRLGVKVEHMTLGVPNQSIPFMDLSHVRMTIPLSSLLNRNDALRGSIYVAHVRLATLHLQQAKMKIEWKNNTLTLSPITATLYQGSVSGIVRGSQLSTFPRWDGDMQWNNIQLQPLFQDVNSKIKLSGIGKMALQINTVGKNKDQLIRNLNGMATFNVDQGILYGIDLNYLVQTADALLNKQSPHVPPKDNETPFNQMMGSAIIKNGVATSENLLVTSSAFTTKGLGAINFIDQTLTYQLQVAPLQTAKIKWAIPMIITGSLQNPSVRLDMLKLNTLIAQEQFEKIKTKIQKEVKLLPGKVDKLLQRFMDNQ
ncbi:MAG: hypothetical protein A3F42_01195 [Gammaproteobacteria bacterium RIFCSPHIGHO2_12_FULL_37_34]|nr:MAG: hypothetical protein A3F42_01195 [Gammaproteobacteria bacterium RIFCSPHIGHO2_12_FULL_37_34]